MTIMTNEIRAKIRMYIKNRIDISPLIKDVSIKGENLSRAIISDFNRVNENINNTKFSYTTIGAEGKTTVLSRNKMRNCEFIGTKFKGKVFFRRNDCTGSNFNGAICSNVEYQYTDFTNCTFCECVLRIGTAFSYKCKFDTSFFKDLIKGTNLELVEKKEKNDN